MELVNFAKRDNHYYSGPQDIGFLPEEEVFRRKLKNDIVRDIPHVSNKHIQAVYICHNNFLLAQYLLKLEEAQSKFPDCTERCLYHATSQSCLESILFNGLDWRRTVRHKFGKGVNFAVSPNYADEYASAKGGKERVLLKCRVIVGRQHVGNSYTSVPDPEADTTTSGYSMEQVFVKFQNNEFFPLYAIFYDPPYIRSGREFLNYSNSSSNRPLFRDDLILRPFVPQEFVRKKFRIVRASRPKTAVTNGIAAISVGESENAEAVAKSSSDPRDSKNVGIFVSSENISVNLEPSNHSKIQTVPLSLEIPASSPITTYLRIEGSTVFPKMTPKSGPIIPSLILIFIVFLIIIFLIIIFSISAFFFFFK